MAQRPRVQKAKSEPAPPAVPVEGGPGQQPTRVVKTEALRMLSGVLMSQFEQFARDRQLAEQKWLRNLRQYLGIYDPEIEKELSPERSRAYPRITRVKCLSVLARIMHLMFPGDERNWEIKASPSADMKIEDVEEMIGKMAEEDAQSGVARSMSNSMVQAAVQKLANERAEALSLFIDDQLQELGGDQTMDYVALNRAVAGSGILYGLGVLRGPFVRKIENTGWVVSSGGKPEPQVKTIYKPMYEFLPVWDFYPDMAAKTMLHVDTYFYRLVMSRSQVRELADRANFFADVIKKYLTDNPNGDYKAKNFEQELKTMGLKANVNENQTATGRYEVIIYNGTLSGAQLRDCGADVPDDKLSDEIEADVWMLGGRIIKADINAWRKLGMKMRTIHGFVFDPDDTSPIANGLPSVIRDSQMSIAASTRMLLDNASVVCGPNLELNVDLLIPEQDRTSIRAYKTWEREGLGQDAMAPAVRNVTIDGHLGELMKIIEMFMQFADTESFVGPATGGDMSRQPSEPMRTAAGASMLRGDAALPFKDIVRNFDSFTQSLLQSMVMFNKKFNPDASREGDFNVIARGATSLIAKEVRGMQIDQLAASLSDEDKMYIDDEKFMKARFASRDLTDMLASDDEVMRRKAQKAQEQQRQIEMQEKAAAGALRKTLAEAMKNITQGQKNAANADATTANTVIELLLAGVEQDVTNTEGSGSGDGSGSSQLKSIN